MAKIILQNLSLSMIFLVHFFQFQSTNYSFNEKPS